MADPVRLTVDPSTQFCPEYDNPFFAPMVQSFRRDNNIATDAAAIQRLTADWTVYNDQRKQAWAAQVAADGIAAAAVEAQERAAAEVLQKASADQAALEAEKKKPKLGAFNPSLGVSNHLVYRPSAFATQRLLNGDYVELWYFTPQGCRDATENQGVTASDVLSFVTSNDSLALQPTSSLQASRKVVPDHELTFSDMCVAKSLFLIEITRLGWPDAHVKSLVNFFHLIENHPRRRELAPGEKDLLLYQAEVRKQWHDLLKTDDGFNIAVFNETKLDNISAAYRRSTEAHNHAVRPSTLLSPVLLCSSLLPHASFLPPLLIILPTCHSRSSRTAHPTSRVPASALSYLPAFPRSHPALPFSVHRTLPCVPINCVPFNCVPVNCVPSAAAYYAPVFPLRTAPSCNRQFAHNQGHYGASRPPRRDRAQDSRNTHDRRQTSQRDRQRSASPRRFRDRRRSPSPQRQRDPRPRRADTRQVFGTSAGPSGSACAICLGRHPHEVSKCQSPTFWNQAPARCRRNSSGRIVNPGNVQLCIDWQRPRGCPSTSHNERHECSGCGSRSHGAATCGLAQSS